MFDRLKKFFGFGKAPAAQFRSSNGTSTPALALKVEVVIFTKAEVEAVLNELLAVRNKVSDQFETPYEEARFDRAIGLLHRAVV
jgi:hypothetical protein